MLFMFVLRMCACAILFANAKRLYNKTRTWVDDLFIYVLLFSSAFFFVKAVMCLPAAIF